MEASTNITAIQVAWEKGRDRIASTPDQIFGFVIIIMFISIAAAINNKATGGEVMGYIVLRLASLGVLYKLVKHLAFRQSKKVVSSSHVQPLSERFTDLRADINALAGKAGLDPQHVKVLQNTMDARIGPSALLYRDAHYIVIPLGFIQLYKKDRSSAIAMLAHELGHVKQQDAVILWFANGYQKIFRSYLMPFLVVFYFIAACWQISSYLESVESADRMRGALVVDTWSGGSVDIVERLGRIDAEGNRGKDSIMRLIDVIVNLSFIPLILLYLRGKRRLSEQTADLHAAMLVGTEETKVALRYGQDVTGSDNILSMQPTTRWRLKQLELF
jgi:Zn-dependent protease with chaperone function